ncbi:putative proteasomal ubiquitin receptor Rpn13/ADRM1, UCH-binding domain-containing protein [Plasmopara halstedii]
MINSLSILLILFLPDPANSSATHSTSSTPAPYAATAAPTSTNHGAGTLTTADLQRAMSSFQQFAQRKVVSMTKLLSADNLSMVLDDADCVRALLPHLPEGSQTPDELRATLRSPQFRQSIGSLASALQTGSFNTVMASFGLNCSAGADKLAAGDGVGVLLAAIQAWADLRDASIKTPVDRSNTSEQR